MEGSGCVSQGSERRSRLRLVKQFWVRNGVAVKERSGRSGNESAAFGSAVKARFGESGIAKAWQDHAVKRRDGGTFR